MILIRLYLNFFMTGLFSIGGGLATVPFLYDIASRTGWFSASDIADMIAVSEATPGAIGINMATYSGYTTAGILGDLVATLGLITPGIIIIIILSKILNKFRENKYVDWTLYGLRAGSIGLIFSASVSVFKVTLFSPDTVFAGMTFTGLVNAFNYKSLLLGIIIFLGMKYLKKVHPIFFILGAGLTGVIFSFAGV